MSLSQLLISMAFFALANAQAPVRQNVYINEEPFNKWAHGGVALAICYGILAVSLVIIMLIHRFCMKTAE